jgi:SAM-dependent methyltransferase
MLDNVINLLYRRPELYELVYPEPNFSTPRFCREMFNHLLGRDPQSILDVGCGTGRDLATLADWCGADCHGIDGLNEMIDYACRIRPHIRWSVADMRQFRLGRTFEVIISLGGVITYALADEDLDATFQSFAAHAQEGTVLLLDLPNAASYLTGGKAKTEREFSVETPHFSARAFVRYEFDRPQQYLIRRRRWMFPDGSTEEDFCQYRMLFPAELTHRLRLAGFQVTSLFDNQDRQRTELDGLTLYVAARYSGEPIGVRS